MSNKKTEMSKESWKEKTRQLKTEVHALYLAFRDPRVPWYARVLMAFIIGYAVCPIDLVPDFIPVLGQIDDLIIVPVGISIVLRMIPKSVMEECRQRAREEPIRTRTKWVVTILIISIWAVAIYLMLRLVWLLF